jgi:hypothetical protein
MRCYDTLIDFDLMRYARIIRGVVLHCEFACNSNAPGGFLRLNVRAMDFSPGMSLALVHNLKSSILRPKDRMFPVCNFVASS